MSDKDITQKILEDYNDVFADIVNNLLYNGEQVVKPEELSPATARSMYKADGKLHEQERDCAKYWKRQKICFSLYGLENQIKADKYMPVRIVGYDGANYRKQLCDKEYKENGMIYPVVTLVLYFGKEKWKNCSLYDCVSIPDNLREYVSDYHINVFDISHMTDEQINMFKSDFRYVADFFAQTCRNDSYKPTPGELEHADATLKCLTALTHDNKWEYSIDKVNEEGGPVTMCDVLDKVEAKGEARGEARGMSQMKEAMLLIIKGYNSVDELVKQGIPENIARFALK